MKKVILFSKKGLGENVIRNGDFATDTDWTKGTGWTITGGRAVATSASGNLFQNPPLTNGKTYLVEYTIISISGAIRCNLGGGIGTPRSSAGTYSEQIVSSGNTLVVFDPSGTINAEIDNVSVREVL